jgi:ribose transport system substrate-binding protein
MNWKRVLPVVLMVVVVVVVAGCGSSSSSSSGSTAAATSSASTSASMATAKAETEKLEKRPTSIGITEPIKGTIPPGKTIAYLQCAFADCVQIGEYVKAAASKVGWTTSIINAGATPETIKASWEEALRQHPDAIIQTGSPEPSYYKAQLEQSQKEKIPLIGIAERPGVPLLASIGSGPNQGIIQSGIQGVNVASKTDDGKALAIGVPGIGIIEEETANFQKVLKERCQKCTTEELKVPATSLGKNAPQLIASYLQAHTDVEYIFFPTIDLALGLEAAFKAAGIGHKVIVAQSDDTPGIEALKRGEAGLQSTTLYPDVEGGYRAIDALIRHYTGQSLTVDEDKYAPQWLITAKNIPPERPVSGVNNYVEEYTKLWGVK